MKWILIEWLKLGCRVTCLAVLHRHKENQLVEKFVQVFVQCMPSTTAICGKINSFSTNRYGASVFGLFKICKQWVALATSISLRWAKSYSVCAIARTWFANKKGAPIRHDSLSAIRKVMPGSCVWEFRLHNIRTIESQRTVCAWHERNAGIGQIKTH